jgi:acyl-CoA dehydrogenase
MEFGDLLTQVKQFIQHRLIPNEEIVDETDSVPPDLINEMRTLGLFGLTIPIEYGGSNLKVEQEALLLFEFGKTSPAFHSIFGTNNGIGAAGLVMAGTPAQKAHYLPKMASGEIIGAFALSEQNAGSDAAAVATSAVPAPGGWSLSGTKRFVTNGPIANLVTVLARTDAEHPNTSGLSTFLVDMDTPGVSLGERIKKMGHRGSPVAPITFDGCFVPEAKLLGELHQGYKLALCVLSRGRLRVAALCVGIAERLIADGLQYALTRHQFGNPISEFQLTQAKLADCETELFAGRAAVIAATRLADAGHDVKREAACAKLFCSDIVSRIADRVLQIHGGPGYTTEHSIERFYRDVRLFRIYEGTSEIQQLIIARDMLKNPRPLFT